jgi:hypothetical protein
MFNKILFCRRHELRNRFILLDYNVECIRFSAIFYAKILMKEVVGLCNNFINNKPCKKRKSTNKMVFFKIKILK